ncbi:hypothetical protein QDR37_01125 [Amnibacterium sp. CER49]|nr:hypothetical protein [Amnibacterium sp. CER49]MDH2442537.1 hypothetical protein [Amnibacterium sp. CER49]
MASATCDRCGGSRLVEVRLPEHDAPEAVLCVACGAVSPAG